LKTLRDEGSDVPVLIVSALDTAKTAVEALRVGAADYLVKGLNSRATAASSESAKLTGLEKENSALRSQLATEGQFGAMMDVLRECGAL